MLRRRLFASRNASRSRSISVTKSPFVSPSSTGSGIGEVSSGGIGTILVGLAAQAVKHSARNALLSPSAAFRVVGIQVLPVAFALA